MRLETAGLVVRDMGESLAFYRLMGLPIPDGQDDDPHVEYAPAGGCGLGFAAEAMVRQIDPNWKDGRDQYRVSLQFRCNTPTEVDAAHARLVIAGHRSYKEPWDAVWGQRFARVYDPDGNVVSLFCPLDE